jgi:hypothetical protein
MQRKNLPHIFIILIFSILLATSPHTIHAQTQSYLIQDLLFFPQRNWQQIPPTSTRQLAHWLIPRPPVLPPPRTSIKKNIKPTQAPQESQTLPQQPEDNSPLELIIYYFGSSNPDDLQTNIKAWQEEIEPSPILTNRPTPTTTTRKIANYYTAHEIKLNGQLKIIAPYPSLPPITLPNYQLIGLIIEKPEGNLYLRLTGPTQSIDRFKKTWNDFISSIRLAKSTPKTTFTPLQKK